LEHRKAEFLPRDLGHPIECGKTLVQVVSLAGDLVVENFEPHPFGVLRAIELRVDDRDGRDLREVLEHREVGRREHRLAQESVNDERADARSLEDQRGGHRGLRGA
jgi:hypothetical protein